MKNLFISSLLILSLILNGFSQNNPSTTIIWDTWGVPHIKSDNLEDLFFAQGWAEMHNHANHIIELFGVSRGRGAEYWGKAKLIDDMLIHTLGFSELADTWEKTQDPTTKKIYDSFVRGLNAYADAHPEAIEEANKKLLPLTSKDAKMHSMYIVFTRFIGGGDLGRVQEWPDMGSNAYAIGPSKSASGNAMLVQNPHLQWFGGFLFFETHFNLNGKNMYGANLVGLPGIAIGFNDHLGWSHTDNTIDNADTYELDLKDGGYLIDGERNDFEVSSKTIKIKQEDGTLIEQDIPIMKTRYGPVVKKSEDKVLAIRMVGMDRPDMALQWWKMINAATFDEFETALKMAQIPFWNVMYADDAGNIFYLFNGLVPKRSSGDWKYWNRFIPGGKSADLWTEVHSYSDLPKVKNPETGWLQNSNDPPWTSTLPMILKPSDFPSYMAPIYMSYRSQRAARMLMEDNSITFDELVDYKLSTHLEFADRILDDLEIAVENSNSDKAKVAMKVLNAWDREADNDSRGTLLFYNWAIKFNLRKDGNYAQAWSFDSPNTTPDGISDPKNAVSSLENAANEIEAGFGKLDVAWGDYYRITYGDKDLPANGMDGALGTFRVAWPGRVDATHAYVGGGDSWVGVIEFGETPRAKVLLSYGNATQKDSPHFGDQLELFSKKELREAWFTDSEIEANTNYVEVLTGNTFVKE